MGPDAYPDILVGQTIVHPGFVSGWKTDDWLKHVLQDAQSAPNDSRLALAYGYLSHAAVDIWAHTYINEYAGDVFLLPDGETTVERRHVLLESLISKATPPLRDHLNNTLAIITMSRSTPSTSQLFAQASFTTTMQHRNIGYKKRGYI